mmetsp:Transcript_59102/g.183505  ORF Transcript_59102/g.183505 Transcript_59102/m.183505 type:complete len:216 (-) Transcript_59102:50-697(-)
MGVLLDDEELVQLASGKSGVRVGSLLLHLLGHLQWSLEHEVICATFSRSRLDHLHASRVRAGGLGNGLGEALGEVRREWAVHLQAPLRDDRHPRRAGGLGIELLLQRLHLAKDPLLFLLRGLHASGLGSRRRTVGSPVGDAAGLGLGLRGVARCHPSYSTMPLPAMPMGMAMMELVPVTVVVPVSPVSPQLGCCRCANYVDEHGNNHYEEQRKPH